MRHPQITPLMLAMALVGCSVKTRNSEHLLAQTLAEVQVVNGEEWVGIDSDQLDTAKNQERVKRLTYSYYMQALPTGEAPNGAHCPWTPRQGYFDSRYGSEFTICVDATSGIRVTEIPQDRQYLHPLPHQNIRVRVFHDAGVGISVSSNGKVQATTSGVDRQTDTKDEVGEPKAESRLTSKDVGEAKTTLQDAKNALTSSGNTGTIPGNTISEKLAGALPMLDKAISNSAAGAASLTALAQARRGVVEAKAHYQIRTYSDFILGPFGDGDLEITVSRNEPLSPDLLEDIDNLVAAVNAHDPDPTAKMDRTGLPAAVREVTRALETLEAALRKIKSTSAADVQPYRAAMATVDTESTVQKIVYIAPVAVGVTPVTTAQEQAAVIAVLDQYAALAKKLDAIPLKLEGASKPTSMKRTWVVDKTYIGSVSVGIGMFIGGATNGKYTVETANGGTAAYIDGAGTSPFELDMTVGYTHLFHHRPESSTIIDGGVTFGLNAASLSGGDLEALNGVYFGPTLGSRNLTGALVLSARKVDRLKDQFTRGQVVTIDTKPADLTSNRLGLGIGIVIYAPELIKTGQK